jgi:uncharacterized protein (DUF952 family)
MPHPDFAYKVAPRVLLDAARAKARFLGAPVDFGDGYIHLSTAEQLGETLRRYFAGHRDLVVFAVCVADFGSAIVWEPSRGGALFPHLYAALPMSAVIHVASIDVAADGSVTLPDWVR